MGDTTNDVEKQTDRIPASTFSSPTRVLYPPAENESDPFLVTYTGKDDPLDPQNIAMWKKWTYSLMLGFITLSVTFASSIFSTATEAAAREFGVSNLVMTLGTALFIVGFSVGPMIYGPMSELYGRKRPLFAGHALFIICQIPVAVAQNVETIMLFRFLGGVVSSGPLAITGGWFADFFDPVQRGLAMAVLSGTTLLGPILGPIIGGFLTQSYLGWRWTAWMTMVVAGLFGVIGLLFVPETYAGTLLTAKAAKLRQQTGNFAYHSKLEETGLHLNSFVTRYLSRPFRMLLLEPILVLITLYMTFIYGFIYLLFEAWPISFQQQRGLNEGVGALPFLAIGVGVAIGTAYIAWYTWTVVTKRFLANGYVIPEDRLQPMIVGAFVYPAGIFWFAWCSLTSVNIWAQVIAGVPIGFGIMVIYLQGLAYMVDVYTVNANSAISANAIVRSIVAAGFVMFAVPMYDRLGVQWATTLLGFLAALFVPVPFLFKIYGARIRKMSRYAPR